MATGDFVTVACKVPNGLTIDLREPPVVLHTPHGDQLVSGPIKQRVTLRGPAPQRKMDVDGATLGEHPMVKGGYGITENVPKDFFDAWMAENKHYAPVAAGAIWALPNIASVRSKAVERAEVRSGFEPLDPRVAREAGIKIEPLSKDD